MSRELKRVPLDFEWPIDKVWQGFIMSENLQPATCPHCENGYSPESKHLHDRWYGYVPFHPEDRDSVPHTIDTPAVRAFAERNVNHSPEYYGRGEFAVIREATRLSRMWNQQWAHHLNQADVDALVEGDRLRDLTHRWEDGKWVPTGHHPTAAEVNDWSMRGMGHDSINSWIVIKAECERLGVLSYCTHCGGDGVVYADDEHKAAHDAWEPTEPPEGVGYQMWESVSEGSPISPVFEAPEALATYLVRRYPDYATYDQWMKMILGPGWAPSMVGSAAGFVTGVAAG